MSYAVRNDLKGWRMVADPSECTDDETWQENAPALPVATVEVVTIRQCRLFLLYSGKLPEVQAAIAALPSPAKEAAQIAWDYSSEVRRNDPLVLGIVSQLGWSAATVDEWFTEANKL
mgnify:CR=1 FL=1